MSTAETATPESRAADRTSVGWLFSEDCRNVSRVLTVVFPPPRKVSTPDDIIEDEPGDGPGYVVLSRVVSIRSIHCQRNTYHSVCGRDVRSSVEDNREVEVFEDRVGPLLANEVSSNRGECPS